ncbi:MAG: lysine biosynthesis protein LysX [Thaumarchaeota archaeon]|nr:lysine biosynthesis protein LysX [Nitrososphaerota archaeon]
MVADVELIFDVPRLEEKLILEELKKAELNLQLTNVKYHPLLWGDKPAEISLIRTISMQRAAYSASIREAAGARAINSLKAILIAGDKILTLSELWRAGISFPKSVVALNGEAAEKAGELIGFPIIDKPPIGSWGRLVALVKDLQSFKSIIEHRELYQSQALKTHLIQRYVNGGCRDLRILVLGEEVLGAVQRIATNGDWRSNVARGGLVKEAEVDEELRELALKVSSVIGGEFLAVDFFEEDGSYLVNEVNGVPEFKGFMEATRKNVPRKLVEYLKKILKS